MDLSQDFKEFIALLNKHRVRYLVIGGYAVTVHGYPRYTKDLDVWVHAVPKNAHRLLAFCASLVLAHLTYKQAISLRPTTLFNWATRRIE